MTVSITHSFVSADSDGPDATQIQPSGWNADHTVPVATAAHFRAKTADKLLATDPVWDAAALVSLTDAATILVDMSTFFNATVTLGGNRTLGNPSNTKVGQGGFIEIIQDGTGTRTLAYGSNWKFSNGTVPTASTTAGTKDYLFYKVVSSTFILASLNKAFS